MGTNQLLVGAINESLQSLGTPIKKTIVWHLNHNGLYLDDKREMDIRAFHEHLEQIVGSISEVVLDEIYERLQQGLKIEPVSNSSADTVERIEKLLRSHQGGLSA